jgi:hypothetical protein
MPLSRTPVRRATRTYRPALLLVLLAACQGDALLTPAARGQEETLAAKVAANDSLITSTRSAAQRDTAGRSAAGTPSIGIGNLPASLALSAAQREQIAALQAKYTQETAADSAAYAAIVTQALAARAAGATSEAINAIMAPALAIEQRLAAARAALNTALEAVLTPAQREWLAQCAAPRALSAAQAEQVAAREQAFRTAMAADLAAIDKALADITALRGSGQASSAIEAQIRSILEQVTPARERLRAAQQQLAADIAQIIGTTTCQGS